MTVSIDDSKMIRGVLERFSLEVNDNVIELYHDALCRVLNDSEASIQSLTKEGFDKDALVMMYEIEMDND